MLSTWDDLWEFWDFWKFFENFEFHKIRLLTTEAVSPEAVLNSEPSKNTSEQLFFLSTSKIKDGVKFKFAESLQSVAIGCNQQQPTEHTHSRIFQKYIILYTVSCIDPKKWSFWSLTSLADSLKSTLVTNAVTHVTFVTGQFKKWDNQVWLSLIVGLKLHIMAFSSTDKNFTNEKNFWRSKIWTCGDHKLLWKAGILWDFNKNSKFSTIWVPLKQRIPDLKWH